MGFRLQHAAAALGKKRKRKKSISKIPASMIHHPVESVLTNKDLLVQVFSFLPMNDIQACGFVSKIFYQVIEKEIPLKLRIEDRGKNLLWIFRPSWKLDKHGRSDRDEMVCPFFKIGSIPPKNRKRVTELTLVMMLVQERLDDYDLESMVDILKDFCESCRVLVLEIRSVVSSNTKVTFHSCERFSSLDIVSMFSEQITHYWSIAQMVRGSQRSITFEAAGALFKI